MCKISINLHFVISNRFRSLIQLRYVKKRQQVLLGCNIFWQEAEDRVRSW